MRPFDRRGMAERHTIRLARLRRVFLSAQVFAEETRLLLALEGGEWDRDARQLSEMAEVVGPLATKIYYGYQRQ